MTEDMTILVIFKVPKIVSIKHISVRNARLKVTRSERRRKKKYGHVGNVNIK